MRQHFWPDWRTRVVNPIEREDTRLRCEKCGSVLRRANPGPHCDPCADTEGPLFDYSRTEVATIHPIVTGPTPVLQRFVRSGANRFLLPMEVMQRRARVAETCCVYRQTAEKLGLPVRVERDGELVYLVREEG